MAVDLNSVYPNADEWTINITLVADYLRAYAEPAGDIVMVWMHAPIIMISPGFYLRAGHFFLLALLFILLAYIHRRS